MWGVRGEVLWVVDEGDLSGVWLGASDGEIRMPGSERTGYCFSCEKLLFDDETREHRDEGHHVGYVHLLSHPRAPPPTPPRSPHPDHAPEPPDLEVEERNVAVPCPRCGLESFGRRYEDGSLWSGAHSNPRNVGWCRPQPVVVQESLGAF